MISWIQKTFQQHFRIIFLILLGGLIVSFVISFGPSSGLSGAHNKIKNETFFDLNLATPADQRSLFGDAQLSMQLTAGYAALQGTQFQQYALQRYAALHLASQLQLPSPTNDEVVAHIRTLRMFAGSNGQFDPQSYATFCDSLKTNPQLHESDVLRVISDDVTYTRIEHLLGGPGYVLPGEVKSQLTHADTLWTIDTVNVDYSSFKIAVTPTAAELQTYFSDNAFRYQVAPQVSLDYLSFPTASFLPQVKVTDDEVRAYYQADVSRFPAPTTPVAPALLATPASQTDAGFAAVRSKVETALKLDRARRLAAEAASNIAVSLYENKVTLADLPAFLAAHKLALKSVAPFAQDNVPDELLGGGKQVPNSAFQLSADQPFSDVVKTGSGSAILIWKATLPAHPPTYAEVSARVTADYLDNEKHKRFATLGLELHALLADSLKAGDTLEKAVASARVVTNTKLTIKTWPSFTLANPPQDINPTLYGAIDTLQKGQLTQMITSDDNGMIAYAADQKIPNLDASGTEFTSTRAKLANYTASRDASDYLRQMVDRELSHLPPGALDQ